MTDVPTCLRCGNDMTLGVVWDLGGGSGFRWTKWRIERIPIHKLFSTKIEQIPVKAFRCERCGYVELSAPSKSQ